MPYVNPKKAGLIAKCYDYLYTNFGRFKQSDQIRVALAIAGKDIGSVDPATMQRIINIVNHYSGNNSTDKGVQTEPIRNRCVEPSGAVQTNLLAPPSKENNTGDKQTDKGIGTEREQSVPILCADIQPGKGNSLARSHDVKVLPAERTLEKGTK